MKIRIFLLRIFVKFLGLVGVSLTPLKWRQHWRMLTWDLCLNILIWYVLFNLRKLSILKEEEIRVAEVSGNMFGYMVDYISERLYLLTYAFFSIHLCLAGHRIVQVLDCPKFLAIYPSDDRGHRIRCWGLLFAVVFFAVVYYESYNALSFLPRYGGIIEFIKFYVVSVVNIVNELSVLMTYYFKYAMFHLIHKMVNDFRNDRITGWEAFQEIRLLADYSRRFNEVTGLFLLGFIIRETFYSTVGLLRVYKRQIFVPFLVLSLLHLVYVIFLCKLDERIQNEIAKLAWHLKHKRTVLQRTAASNAEVHSVRTIIQRVHDRIRTDRLQLGDLESLSGCLIRFLKKSPIGHRSICYAEMLDVYQEDFRLNICDFLMLDNSFLLNNTAFTIMLFVLMIQTDGV